MQTCGVKVEYMGENLKDKNIAVNCDVLLI